MPGQFSKANRPRRPGAYFNFEGVPTATLPPATGAIVAIPFTHNWGPFKEAVPLGSYAEFVATYGEYGDVPTPGKIAVWQAFRGEGVAGRAGAGTVLAYRTGGSSAAKASITLVNTAGTPANAITLSARYEGTKGNDLRVTVQDYAADVTKDELIVYDGTVELERFQYDNTDITDLAAQINAGSDWLSAGAVTSGTSLALVTAQPLTGGDDGATLAAGDWTALMTALETERFAFLAPYDLTDSSILTSLKTWAQNLNANGKRFTTVVGGDAGESVTDAVTRSASLNDPDFVNVGVGSAVDVDVNPNAETTLSTSQLAPRIAGILAARGESQSISFARMAGLDRLVAGATEQGILTAFDGGVVVLARDSSAVPIRVEKGLTTFTTQNDEHRPYLIFRQPKFVATMHGLETELTEYAEANVIGQLPINDKTRQLLVGEFGSRLRRREDAGILQAGSTVGIDPDPPPSDSDEFVALVYGIAFGRSVEQVYNTVRVG